jgi:hypothetical protein
VVYQCLERTQTLLRGRALFGRSFHEKADVAAEIEDPMMRLVSKLRRCTAGMCANPMSREKGSFEKSDEDSEEPARTERLLARPFKVFHDNPGDAYDALSLFWLTRSSGGRAVGVFYDMICFLVMISLGVVLGLEEVASDHAMEKHQGWAVVGLQIGLAFFIFVFVPSNDRLFVNQRPNVASPLSAHSFGVRDRATTEKTYRTGFR